MSSRKSPCLKKLFLFISIFCFLTQLIGQEAKSTQDLSFLVGTWDIVRTYNPDSDSPRILKGTLTCQNAMDDQFISCTYEMQRPGRIRALDQVFFNYNKIYDRYESLWLSSTWPIKVLMHGNLMKNKSKILLNTSAEFEIENEVMEYVRGELVLTKPDKPKRSFIRNTHIRTSEDPHDTWRHHMTEEAKRLKQ